MAKKKRKPWPITLVDERLCAPGHLFADGRARNVHVYCVEHTDRGDVAYAEVGIALMTFKRSDLTARKR